MSGADVQAALAARKLGWPVIMLTAHGDAASARNALKAGAQVRVSVRRAQSGTDLESLRQSVEIARNFRRVSGNYRRTAVPTLCRR